MAMIGSLELNRAEYEDAEVARTFAFRSLAARDSAEGEDRAGRYAASHSGFSHVDAISLPGVRMLPSGGHGTL